MLFGLESKTKNIDGSAKFEGETCDWSGCDWGGTSQDSHPLYETLELPGLLSNYTTLDSCSWS